MVETLESHFNSSTYYSSSPGTYCNEFTINQNTLVTQIAIYCFTVGGSTWYPRIYDANGVRIGSGPGITPVSSTWNILVLDSPVTLLYGGVYKVGYYSNSYRGGTVTSNSTAHFHMSSPAARFSANYSTTPAKYADSADVNPTTGGTYELSLKMYVETPDAAPTTSITSPVANQKIDPRKPLSVTWTYSDADGDSQTSASVNWRKNGTSDAFTSYSITGAGTSYTIPANTLPDGFDIELYVQVYNAKANSASPHVVFSSDSWSYDSEVVTSTQSGQWPSDLSTLSGTYEIQVATADSTNGFGSWSNTVTVTIVDTNVYVFNGALWEPKIREIFDGSVWKIHLVDNF